MVSRRIHIRPVLRGSVARKRFRRNVQPARDITLETHSPVVVKFDLRNGALESLRDYLVKHRGIPDPDVADALIELIDGDYPEAKYRLIVTEHPNTPKRVGGRPRKTSISPSERDRTITACYQKHLSIEGKIYRAREQTCAELGVSEIAVKRALRRTEVEQERQAKEQLKRDGSAALAHNRQRALRKLRT